MKKLCQPQQDDLDFYKEQMCKIEFNRTTINGAIKCFESSLNWKESGAIRPNQPALIRAKIAFLQSVLELDSQGEVRLQEEENKLQEITDEDISRKFLNILESAKRRGKEFNLSLSEVKKLLNRKTCFYTGVKLVKALHDQVENPVEGARTFDRIDSELGYVIGNVVACSHFANQLKNDLFESPKGIALGKEILVRKMMEKLI